MVRQPQFRRFGFSLIARGFIGAVAMSCLLSASQVHAAIELVINGGFETGNFSGWTTTPAASQSLFFVASGVGVGGSNAALFQANSPSLLYDSIAQSLPTTPGDTYMFSFFGANFDISGDDSLQVLWDGMLVFDETPVVSLSTHPTFAQFSFPVVASGLSTVLEIRAYDLPNSLIIDNVSVMAVDAPAGEVPEPASLLAWGGLALLGAVAAVVRARRA